mmetsp:Transcript_36985/g.47149  ORF Transcript_36985/g.47149 Transcript_36985/m.47149 type:complete len:88 (-) Transcript_36985:35-298(-)
MQWLFKLNVSCKTGAGQILISWISERVVVTRYAYGLDTMARCQVRMWLDSHGIGGATSIIQGRGIMIIHCNCWEHSALCTITVNRAL